MDFPLAMGFITSNVVFLHHNCFYCNNQVHFSPGWFALPSKGTKTWRCKINGKEISFGLLRKTRVEHYLELCLRVWVQKWVCRTWKYFLCSSREEILCWHWPRTTVCPWLGKQQPPASAALSAGLSGVGYQPPGVGSWNRITATEVTLVPQNVKWKFSISVLHSTCFLWSWCIFWISHSWHQAHFLFCSASVSPCLQT